MAQWQKQFDIKIGNHLPNIEINEEVSHYIKDFISTEIIEKLIEEIPEFDDADLRLRTYMEGIKQQLRDKWL